eukprot:CAMPEP_0170153950 /NCGR_PEP_ID=MMETSP0033_2-20121228/56668_1 /TAXON_ID=195969 /ORGANISM="Dolichomastix tenuilepis, Strain CCMP3274" /LENGTH=140 /DNA_ID=CAMNT_0010391171 /DNA_START=118 /DNA_END=536 /DNA_ORIENTATION=-
MYFVGAGFVLLVLAVGSDATGISANTVYGGSSTNANAQWACSWDNMATANGIIPPVNSEDCTGSHQTGERVLAAISCTGHWRQDGFASLQFHQSVDQPCVVGPNPKILVKGYRTRCSGTCIKPSGPNVDIPAVSRDSYWG